MPSLPGRWCWLSGRVDCQDLCQVVCDVHSHELGALHRLHCTAIYDEIKIIVVTPVDE